MAKAFDLKKTQFGLFLGELINTIYIFFSLQAVTVSSTDSLNRRSSLSDHHDVKGSQMMFHSLQPYCASMLKIMKCTKISHDSLILSIDQLYILKLKINVVIWTA